MVSRIERRNGIALVWVTIMLIVLVGMAAVVVDIGRVYVARQRAQNVADAAAIAGAWKLDGTVACEVPARVEAVDVAGLNNDKIAEGLSRPVWQVEPTIEGDNTVTVSFPTTIERADGTTITCNPGDAIQIDCKVNVDYGFARILGFQSHDPNATAVATRLLRLCYDLVPWVVCIDDVDATSPGQVMTLKVVDNQESFLGGGNFQAISYMGDRGGDDYRDRICGGAICVDVGSTMDVYTEPGNMIGPTRQGLQCRLQMSLYGNGQEEYERWVNEGQPNDSRIVTVPIVACLAINGRNPLDVVGFGGFYINHFDSDRAQVAVTGIFLSASYNGEMDWGQDEPLEVKGVELVK
jgi:hypothetical protein